MLRDYCARRNVIYRVYKCLHFYDAVIVMTGIFSVGSPRLLFADFIMIYILLSFPSLVCASLVYFLFSLSFDFVTDHLINSAFFFFLF